MLDSGRKTILPDILHFALRYRLNSLLSLQLGPVTEV